ncbi:MAG: ATP-binding cassette domain-containing protein [bacterium]|nr:ATP-binding cassette domain-containing protein [bacterium]
MDFCLDFKTKYNEKMTASINLGDLDKVLIVGEADSGKTAFFESFCEKYAKKSVKTNNKAKFKVSFLPSEPVFFDKKSVLFNLQYALKILKIKDEKIIYELLSRFNFFDYKLKLVKDLTYAEKQKLALIRALVKEPKIILIDDLFTNVSDDLDLLCEVVDLALKQNCLVVIATREKISPNFRFDKIFKISEQGFTELSSYKNYF